ncbi:MAG: hypothetical protein KAY03_02230, partial [Arenimonas sp.]|nr:hypothetical protein [Arenimonas sp.]
MTNTLVRSRQWQLPLGLAWRSLIENRRKFFAILAGVAFAVILVCFQASLLIGFLNSAARIPDRSQAAYWIVPKGVQTVEFGDVMPVGVSDALLAEPGVESVLPLVVGFARYAGPNGERQSVTIIGADQKALSTLLSGDTQRFSADSMVSFDRTSLSMLGVDKAGDRCEINGLTFEVAAPVEDYAS